VIRRERREDDGVDVLRLEPRVLQRHAARRNREIARARAGVLDVATLADAGALDDPLVGGGHELGEVVVGDDLRRDVVADAEDGGAVHGKPAFSA